MPHLHLNSNTNFAPLLVNEIKRFAERVLQIISTNLIFNQFFNTFLINQFQLSNFRLH